MTFFLFGYNKIQHYNILILFRYHNCINGKTMATRRSSNILAESSFIDSLAHLSRSQSRSKSQSRRPSTNNDESSHEIKGRASLHRQENSDAPGSEGGRYSRSATPMAGITKTHEHEVAKSSTVPEERVSFTRSQSQDTKNNHDYLSTPHSHAFATHPRRPLGDSPSWPPPPPPPPPRAINSVPSTTIPSTRNKRKDVSEVLQPEVRLLYCHYRPHLHHVFV